MGPVGRLGRVLVKLAGKGSFCTLLWGRSRVLVLGLERGYLEDGLGGLERAG